MGNMSAYGDILGLFKGKQSYTLKELVGGVGK